MTDFIYQFKIDERVCDDLIEYHKNKNEYKSSNLLGQGEQDKTRKDSIDCRFFEPSNPAVVNYFKQLQFGFDNYLKIYRPLIVVQQLKMALIFSITSATDPNWHFERQTNVYRNF